MRKKDDIEGFWFGYIDAIIMIMSIFLILYIFSQDKAQKMKKDNKEIRDSLKAAYLNLDTTNIKLKSITAKYDSLLAGQKKVKKSIGSAKGTCFSKNKESYINGYIPVEYIFYAVIVDKGVFLVKDNLTKSSNYRIMSFTQIKNNYEEQIYIAKKNSCHLMTYFDFSQKIDKKTLKNSEDLLKSISIPKTGNEIDLVYVVITDYNKINIKGKNIEYSGVEVSYLTKIKGKINNKLCEISCYNNSLSQEMKREIKNEVEKYFLYTYIGYNIEK